MSAMTCANHKRPCPNSKNLDIKPSTLAAALPCGISNLRFETSDSRNATLPAGSLARRRKGEAESKVAAAGARFVANDGAITVRGVAPTDAQKDAVVARVWPGRISRVSASAGKIVVKPVKTPFPHIADHIIKPKSVGPFLPNRVG